ncbi:MAG: hypothetical protein ACAH59_09770 [Pseudobdellovibrionaceae bacterium]
MSKSDLKPPQLCSMSQCDKSLDFSPLQSWPEGLPAVAVNSFVLAGFSREFVFNHQLEENDVEGICTLFRSLYFDLSFAEMARLSQKAKFLSWFPLAALVQKFGWQANDQFFQIADRLVKTPVGFQKWCTEKKVSPQDLAPLLSADGLELKQLFHDILHFQLSKSLGVKALELGIELILQGQTVENLTCQKLLSFVNNGQSPGEAWIAALKQLRYPETFKRDQAQEEKMTSLPWPGTSHAKWIRQGDKTGIELKLFVSQPSDLKKYLQSLNKVQDLLEQEATGTKH